MSEDLKPQVGSEYFIDIRPIAIANPSSANMAALKLQDMLRARPDIRSLIGFAETAVLESVFEALLSIPSEREEIVAWLLSRKCAISDDSGERFAAHCDGWNMALDEAAFGIERGQHLSDDQEQQP